MKYIAKHRKGIRDTEPELPCSHPTGILRTRKLKRRTSAGGRAEGRRGKKPRDARATLCINSRDETDAPIGAYTSFERQRHWCK